MTLPSWLPPMIELDGNWSEKLDHLYQIFERDFIISRPQFKGLPIHWDRRKIDGDTFEEGFWHLITRENKHTNERLPDFRRAERLSWCLPIINNYKDSSVLHFLYDHGRKKIRTYLWVEKADYLVVLEERKNLVFLQTAYHIDGASQRRALRRKYEERIKDDRRHY